MLTIEALQGLRLDFSRVVTHGKATPEFRRRQFAEQFSKGIEVHPGFLEAFARWLNNAIERGEVVPVEPGLFRKAVNLSKATAKHAKKKGLKVPAEVRAERLELCRACELYNREKGTCRHPDCGCVIDSKNPMGFGDLPDREVGRMGVAVSNLKGERMSEKFSPDFTIGMACFDNFDEVYFTVQALRFYHPELMSRWEIVVVDNNPGSKEGEAVRAFINGRVKQNGRYIAWDEVKGSVPPRGKMIDEARGRFVVCIDSHVLLAPGCLAGLTKFFDDNPECDDFLQGPLVSNYGPHRLEGSHMIPRWRSQMFGCWGVDERANDPEGEPFEIPMHGLGLFAVRRASWLRFHPGFSGFSGGEGYIHEKYRQAGRRVLCLPFARWYHKFSRPNGIPHRPSMEDKIRNHIRGWVELGVDLQTGSTVDPIESIADHFIGGGRVSARRFARLAAEAGVPDYQYNRLAIKTGRVIGPTSWGSVKMRGRPIAEHLGFGLLNSRARISLPERERIDVVHAVKCDVPPVVQEKAGRILFDPLDKWFGDRRRARMTPAEWIREEYKRNKFHDLIAATKTLERAAKENLPTSVRVHLVPHAADKRVERIGANPAGPVVYSGLGQFIEPARKSIEKACELLGRRFVVDTSNAPWSVWKAERPSLILAPRIAGRSTMNVECKPTVKIANAVAAGLPVLATPDPAIVSLYFDVRTAPVETWSEPEKLADVIAAAIEDQPSAVSFGFDDWLSRMLEIIG